MMFRRTILAVVLLVLAAACDRAPTDAAPARTPAGAAFDGDPPPDSSGGNTQTDTTGRGGGTIGSGT